MKPVPANSGRGEPLSSNLKLVLESMTELVRSHRNTVASLERVEERILALGERVDNLELTARKAKTTKRRRSSLPSKSVNEEDLLRDIGETVRHAADAPDSLD